MSCTGEAIIDLRPASMADARLLWQWRNDPDVRRQSFSRRRVLWRDHERWLAERLDSPDCRIYVAVVENVPCGVARVERHRPQEGEISISVCTEARGRGIGRALVALAVARAAAEMRLWSVVARIKEGNEASERAFRAAGFELDRTDAGVLHMRWTGNGGKQAA